MAVFLTIPKGDIAIRNHRLVYATGADAIRQKLSTRFNFFLGEWFLDRRQGLPYFQHVFVANPDKQLIRSIFSRVIVRTPGIASVRRLDAIFTLPVRHVAFDFEAVLADNAGTLIVQPTERDFIVNVSI
jgi:hypothetical protein